MSHLVAVVALIALADSLNPSTIAPAVYLAVGPAPLRGVGGFSAGVTAVNLTAGLVLVVGPGQALLALAPHPGSETRRLLELAAAAALAGAAALLWLGRRHIARRMTTFEPTAKRRPAVWLGLGIMSVELPTALPYFAALALIIGSGHALLAQIGLVMLFDVLFVLPLLILLVVRLVLSAAAEKTLISFRAALERRLATALPIAVLAVAAVLFAFAMRA